MRLCYGLLLASIAACGSSTSNSSNPPAAPPPPPPGAPTTTITMTDYQFTPATITIKAGTIVKWVNNGTTTHTATSDAGAFDSGAISAPGTAQDPYGGTTQTPGGSFEMTFSTPGTYSYHCTYHGTLRNMTGTITVNQ